MKDVADRVGALFVMWAPLAFVIYDAVTQTEEPTVGALSAVQTWLPPHRREDGAWIRQWFSSVIAGREKG